MCLCAYNNMPLRYQPVPLVKSIFQFDQKELIRQGVRHFVTGRGQCGPVGVCPGGGCCCLWVNLGFLGPTILALTPKPYKPQCHRRVSTAPMHETHRQNPHLADAATTLDCKCIHFPSLHPFF